MVYLAEQTKPIHRRVALKIIKLGMDTKQVIARFETEREALALMSHPHVARVLDAGTTEQGRPYFVMEHVPGIPITEYCDKHRLNTEERLLLFMDVCHAVQHAHHKGIIHRDLKPSNVLVAVQDDKPVVKVIDFGVAKATQRRLAEETVFTEQGQLIGTPGYMSPEQAEMTALDIDTRTDIYALGVLLYELLAGALPFDAQTLRRAGLAEIQRIIREVDPPRPSTRLSNLGNESTAIAQRRRTEAHSLTRALRGELDWIVMKCLEKDRMRRYDTANALATDLTHFLRNEPVLAGPPGMAYRLRKFTQRNRGAMVVGSLFLTLVIAATSGLVVLYVRAENQREKAEKFAEFMEETLGAVEPSVALGRDTKMLKEIMDGAAKRITNGELKDVLDAELRLRITIAGVYDSIGSFNECDKMLGPVVDMAARLHGRDSREYAEALDAHASWSHRADAENLSEAEEALAIRRRLFPGDHSDVAVSLNTIGRFLRYLERYDDAIP